MSKSDDDDEEDDENNDDEEVDIEEDDDDGKWLEWLEGDVMLRCFGDSRLRWKVGAKDERMLLDGWICEEAERISFTERSFKHPTNAVFPLRFERFFDIVIVVVAELAVWVAIDLFLVLLMVVLINFLKSVLLTNFIKSVLLKFW